MFIVCWDYDGTLVSSELIYKNMFFNYFQEMGLTTKNITNENYFQRYSGKHPLNVIKQLKEDGYIDLNVNINIDKLNYFFQKELKNTNALLLTTNIESILDFLSINNIIMAIVTSTSKSDFIAKYNNFSVSALKKYFKLNENIYICEEIGNKLLKPNPNGYLFAYNDIIKKHDIGNENNFMFMIEDSISGCESANNAKILLKNSVNTIIIGYRVCNKYLSVSELKQAGADYVVDKAEDLKELFEKLLQQA